MSNNLRGALEELMQRVAAREDGWKKAYEANEMTHEDAASATLEDRWAYVEIRTILAANPDNTTTEWGMQNILGTTRPLSSEHEARSIAAEWATEGMTCIPVVRQVTEWVVAP